MPTDSIRNLQPLSWKELKLPFTSAEIGFAHASAEKKFTFRDQALIQRLGRENQTFRYQVPFYDGLRGYGALFTESFSAFYDDCLSRDPGDLVDPLRGSIRCVVATLQVSLDPSQSRDGVMVSIEFVEAPDSIEGAPDGAASLARAAQEAEEARQEMPELPEDPEFQEPLVNPVDAVSGSIDQVSVQRDKFHAQIDRETERVNRLIAANENATDPNKWDAQERLLNYKLALLRANESAYGSGKRVTEEVLQSPKSIITLAASLHISVDEFLGLNPEYTNTPIIPAGFTFKRYREAS